MIENRPSVENLHQLTASVRTWWAEGHPLVSRWTHTEDMQLTWVGRVANRYQNVTRWIRPRWWLTYVLPKPEGCTAPYWRVVWCRLKGHPNGYVYFNPGGMEPDYSCKDCGEEI